MWCEEKRTVFLFLPVRRPTGEQQQHMRTEEEEEERSQSEQQFRDIINTVKSIRINNSDHFSLSLRE